MTAHKKLSESDTFVQVSPDEILDDRDLLDKLFLSDPEAAMLIGKSRQALNNQLGPKGSGRNVEGRDNYFKLSDILVLVSGAKELAKPIKAIAVKAYVEKTRAFEKDAPLYGLLMRLLGDEKIDVDLEGAKAIVFILPAFADMRTYMGSVAAKLREFVAEAKSLTPEPKVFLLSATEMQARMAGQWLGLDRGDNCFGRDIVEHYQPTIVVYRDETEGPRSFVVVEDGVFATPLNFLVPTVADCVRSLLPADVSVELVRGKTDLTDPARGEEMEAD